MVRLSRVVPFQKFDNNGIVAHEVFTVFWGNMVFMWDKILPSWEVKIEEAWIYIYIAKSQCCSSRNRGSFWSWDCLHWGKNPLHKYLINRKYPVKLCYFAMYYKRNNNYH